MTHADALGFGEPQPLFKLPLPARAQFHSTHYDVGRDGRFLATVGDSSASSPASQPVTVSMNATATLRQAASR